MAVVDPADPRRRSFLRRHRVTVAVIAVVVVVAGWVVGRPLAHLAWTDWNDVRTITPTPAGQVDDFSRLNAMPARVFAVPADPAAAQAQLADLLRQARAQHLRVSIAGTRHSEGGHTMTRDGLVVDMRAFDHIAIDVPGKILHVGAGARWSDVITRLDAAGLAMGIMQSDASFSVGGSLSVDCHGWQPHSPPIASSVCAMRVMTADGAVVACSRSENPALFAHVLGGYGLFGIILDADIAVVPNECYRFERRTMASAAYAAAYASVQTEDDAGLAFGRLRVTRERFLQDAILTIARRVPAPDGGMPKLMTNHTGLERTVFRGSAGSDYGKDLRWEAERDWQAAVTPVMMTRNQVMDGDVDAYVTHDDAKTDILQEYFLPWNRLEDFLARLRVIVPRHPCDLLNVTLRDVRADADTALPYAPGDRCAVVMFFEIARTPAADAAMGDEAREAIDAALDLGGRYYLPYRLYATDAQFRRAYPEATAFFAAKRAWDPQGIFANGFSLRYFGAEGGGSASSAVSVPSPPGATHAP